MAGREDGRYRLAKDAVVVYAGLHAERSMAHARLYEAVDQPHVVILGELKDNPGTAVADAIESAAAAVRAAWFADGADVRWLLYDAEEQTFGGLQAEDGLAFVSILDAIGVMPELFNADDYTVAACGGRKAERLRTRALRTQQRTLAAALVSQGGRGTKDGSGGHTTTE